MSKSLFGDRNVKIVIADDNVISRLGSSACSSNRGFAGDYVFSNMTFIASMAFQFTDVTSCLFGEGVKEVPERVFKSCTLLTNLVCLSTDTLKFTVPSNPSGLQKYPVYGCTSLTDYTFYCVPTFAADWNKSAKKNREVRFHVPKSGTGWDEIIESPDFEKWSDSSPEDKAAYKAAFPNGPKPVGYYTGTNVGAWIVHDGAKEGTFLFIM